MRTTQNMVKGIFLSFVLVISIVVQAFPAMNLNNATSKMKGSQVVMHRIEKMGSFPGGNSFKFMFSEYAAADIDSNYLQCHLKMGIIDRRNFNLEDENDANDIPFNTQRIARKIELSSRIDRTDFPLGEEKEVDDIPFDTEKIMENII